MSEFKCFITDLTGNIINSTRDGILEYQIKINGKSLILKFSRRGEDWGSFGYVNNETDYKIIIEPIQKDKYILKSLILNGKWNAKYYDVLNKKILDEQLKLYDYPKSTEDKLNYLFNYLYKQQKFDGDEINLIPIYEREWELLYFKNANEFHFYLYSLATYDYLDVNDKMENGWYVHANFTYKGLLQNVVNENSGKFSNNCFVAMSFEEDDLNEIFGKSINPVLEELKLNPVVINKENFESEKTINDAMIAAIKKSKFMIADFTKQKRNVYFEAGYALGRGMQVIFTCRKDYFNDHIDINKMSAFDTNHYPHIIWEDTEDLKKQLKDRIEAFILQ